MDEMVLGTVNERFAQRIDVMTDMHVYGRLIVGFSA
jgi:predicted transglutaminase-like cysteine proteinase